MLTTTTTTDDDLSPIRKVVSIKNDSFDLINFNDSFNNSISTPSKHTMTKNPNDELDDLLEVTNSTNESEDFWLCEPKKLSTFQVCGKSTNKENLMNNNNKTDDHQSTINPYKWIMEDMDNKNLDKVKRTLLVTLDDISKGLVRRSRSVSNTRNPLLNYQSNGGANQQFNNLSRIDQSMIVDDEQKQEQEMMTKPIQGKNLLNYGLTFKKKKPSYLNNFNNNDNIDLDDSFNNVQQYDDLTDVRVIAKMQEDSLRQSVINLNKSKSAHSSINNLSNQTFELNNNNSNDSHNNSFIFQTPKKQKDLKLLNRNPEEDCSRSNNSISSEQSLNSVDSPINSNLNMNDQSKIKQQSISATNGNDSKLKKVDNSSILKHQSRLPTPRSGRSGETPKAAIINKITNSNSSNSIGKKILNNNELTKVKHSNSNTSIHAKDNVKKPPIPNGNTGIKKSTSLIRNIDKESTQLSLVKGDRTQTPRISSSFMTNRSTSSTTGKVLLTSPTPSSAQQKKKPVLTDAKKPNDLSKTRVVSPSGLLNIDAKFNRKTSLSPAAPGRNEHSVSPSRLNNISSSAVKDKSVMNKKSPSSARKNTGGIRKSMLPQPMSVLARPSTSPSGLRE